MFCINVVYSAPVCIQPFSQLLVFVRVQMGIGIESCFDGLMPQTLRNLQYIKAHVNQHACVAVAQIMYSDLFPVLTL